MAKLAAITRFSGKGCANTQLGIKYLIQMPAQTHKHFTGIKPVIPEEAVILFWLCIADAEITLREILRLYDTAHTHCRSSYDRTYLFHLIISIEYRLLVLPVLYRSAYRFASRVRLAAWRCSCCAGVQPRQRRKVERAGALTNVSPASSTLPPSALNGSVTVKAAKPRPVMTSSAGRAIRISPATAISVGRSSA